MPGYRMAIAEQTIHEQLKASLAELSRPIANDASRRLQRFVAYFRGLVSLTLLLAALLYRDPPVLGARYPEVFLVTAFAYAALAWAGLIYQHRVNYGGVALLPVQLIVDIVSITIMMHASGGISSGIGGLLAVYAGASTLTLRARHAFLVAAISALAILAEQMTSYLLGMSPANAFFPAGVLGAIIFTIASAASPLARRLQESEELAHQRGIDLANMAQLNDYIIQHLRESIVVVDDRENIRLINQSAAEHLGAETREPGRALHSVSPELHKILLGWRRHGTNTREPASFMSADGMTRINTYVAPLEQRKNGPVLIFLEDAGLLAEKVQQSKLAALGRLSASIAHEIRNPVGALSHAGQLLQESEGVGEYERRLLDIISTNSKRTSEIVHSVMQLSRREPTNPELISLADWTAEFVDEFTSTLELGEHKITIAAQQDLQVRMDPGHLHQVCWNLCENAVKYAADGNSDIIIVANFGRLPGNRRPFLEIADRGPGISTEMRDQLFEPFATGRVGETGLGLFISRELCECNNASLIYEPREGGGSIFRIVFADPDRWGAST
jgi:two-component system sensor histidine kinase PilS (NtrC family)